MGVCAGLRAMPADSLSTGYQRGLQTEAWVFGVMLEKNRAERGVLRLQNELISSRLQVPAVGDKWKDQNRIGLEWIRPVRPSLAIQAAARSTVFTDKQTGYINDIQTHFIGLGAAVRHAAVSAPLLVGIKHDRRYGQTDRGWSLETGLDIPRIHLGGYESRLHAALEGDGLGRRKNRGLAFSTVVHRQFAQDTRDSLFVSLRRQRRDYYISERGDIESWDESGQNVENRLQYRLSRTLRVDVDGRLDSRLLAIRQLTDSDPSVKRQRKDFSASGSVRLGFRSAAFVGDGGFTYTGEEQRYRLSKTVPVSPVSGGPFAVAPDNRSSLIALWFRSAGRWSAHDSIVVRSSLQKRQYDTPDPNNIDDRDDLRLWIHVEEIHAFSPAVALRLAADIHTVHLVYLSGGKSADNNRTRVYRLIPSVRFAPARGILMVHTAEVLANFVAYDFETLLPGIRSFLYRKFSLEDSLSANVGGACSLRLFHRLELDENGKFLWDSWQEELLLDRRSQTLQVEFSVSPSRGVVLVPGYTLYRRKGYRYEDVVNPSGTDRKVLSQDFLSHGPMFSLSVRTRRLRLAVRTNTVWVRTFSLPVSKTNRTDLLMSWQFE